MLGHRNAQEYLAYLCISSSRNRKGKRVSFWSHGTDIAALQSIESATFRAENHSRRTRCIGGESALDNRPRPRSIARSMQREECNAQNKWNSEHIAATTCLVDMNRTSDNNFIAG